jgi:uncharacterized phage protein (TIGR01671 family)
MREIKFRAWDKDTDKMFNIIRLSFRDLEVNYTEISLTYNGGERGLDWNDLSHVELMQYTGLKDKNNKEIYEGDIVTGPYGKELVEWDDIGGGFNPFIVTDQDGNHDLVASNCEVLGNIYENPGLL